MDASNLGVDLKRHRDAFAPVYPPDGNSDHGPMTFLALHALGASPAAILRFAEGYRDRLVAPAAAAAAPLRGLEGALGKPSAYADLLRFFDSEIEARGAAATVAHYLPRLASAWVVDAYHPFIRLGYGVEFGVASEIAAGLAYLACCGEDPRLLTIARATPTSTAGRLPAAGSITARGAMDYWTVQFSLQHYPGRGAAAASELHRRGICRALAGVSGSVSRHP